MDKYGYVSNNYHAHAMAGQTRAVAGGGGCRCSSHHHHQQMHMPASQAPCGCKHKGNGAPVMMQPVAGNGNGMMFADEGREWTTGMCGCFEHCASCMAAFCCFWCFNCYLSSQMDENICGPVCGSPFMVALRTRLRAVNGIEGSVCKDMCSFWFCPCCVVSQMYREMKNTSMI